ncbi:MAG: hypothetical protein ACLFRX_01005 [Gemmatimonadota bacterium]
MRRAASLLSAALVGLPAWLGAQDTTRLAPVPRGEEGWNTTRVEELVERARERRRVPMADSALHNYRADVSGFIYFFIDREVEPEPVLLRADQVALELYWGQPDRVKQVIRGMRSEEQFPIRDFRYYIDRYTVIQNGFDDVIRVGEGRDVRRVIHPLAREGGFLYDFRLADSTTIRLPGEPEPLRVYEIQVRPRRFDMPAIVGSLWLERGQGDLVRLAFTFTPASYIDPRNERVEVMLENGLWEGKYWLPREQRLLVRREIPELDLDVGTVIRAALLVQDYDLNVDLPDGFFGGSEVVLAAGPERLAEYDFDEGLFDGFDEVGLEGVEPGTLGAVDVEEVAGRILRERFLPGVPRVRFFAPSASDILRFGRTEGLVTGAGAAIGVRRSQAYLYGGYAWGSGDVLARLGWRPAGPDPSPRTVVEAYLNRPSDVGLRQPAAGVLSSASAALLGRDYRDIVPTTGLTAVRRWGNDRTGRTRLGATIELFRPGEQAHHHAPGDEELRFRPVTPADSGSQARVAAERSRRDRLGPVSLSTGYRIEVGAALPFRHADPDPAALSDGFLRFRGDADVRWVDWRRRLGVEGRATLGLATATTPLHQLWYLGGPGTLPGHPFHAYAGSLAGVADVTAWHDVVPRFLRLRAFGAMGFADGQEPALPAPLPPGDPGDEPPALEPWTPGPSRGLKASVGAGIGLLHGILRVDYALRTDTWGGVWILSVDPDLWSFL